MPSFRAPLVDLVVVASLVAAGCGGQSDAAGGDTKLTLVAYSTPKEAYEEIVPAFAKTPAGKGTSFNQSYGASGDQARAVIGGLPADVVALSLAPDVEKLVEEGLVAKDWARDRFDGFVTNSVVVFAVRKGNPKGIETWDDLVKEGVEVITPNPFTSGGARWNVMAAYGAKRRQGASHEEAVEYLGKLFANVPVQDKSAREALETFSGGKGDVMIAYENEVLTARRKGADLDLVAPDETILIENPVAVVTKSKHREHARAFVDYLRTPAAQRVFTEKGYRPVLKSELDAQQYPAPEELFEIDELGGWSRVTDRFFDPEKGIMAGIERELGVATE